MLRLRFFLLGATVALASCTSASESPIAADATPTPVRPSAVEEPIGLVDCAGLWSPGDEVIEPAADRATFLSIQRDLVTLMEARDPEGIVAVGSGQSGHGRLTVTVSNRSPELRALIEATVLLHAGSLDVACIELPPAEWDDSPVPVLWEVDAGSRPIDAHWQELTLLIYDSCHSRDGLQLPPAFVVEKDRIVMDLRADPLPWGMACTLELRPPRPVVIALPEAPNGRSLDCAEPPCGFPEPLSGATPPPLPPPIPTAD